MAGVAHWKNATLDRPLSVVRSDAPVHRVPPHPARTLYRSLCLLLCLLLCDTLAAAEWQYRVRPGDTIWDLARLHLRADVPWERLQAHNTVDDPGRLAPGTTLRFPVAWLRRQPAPATIVATAGAATATLAGVTTPQPIHAGMRLPVGAILRTGPDASLTLAFADGSRLQLHGDGELHLDRLTAYGTTGMVDTRVRLPRGRVTNLVERRRGPASGFVVETPGLMSSVRGTQFRVASDGDRTRSEVLEGVVDVSGEGRRIRLAAGRGVTADANGRPEAGRALLPPPDITGWDPAIERMPATLTWPAMPDARSYRFLVAADPEFLTLLQDTVVEAPQAHLQVDADGVLYARVRAIDANGLEGLDAMRPLEIAAQPAPPFVVAPTRGGSVPGPRPRFRWTQAPQPQTYRLQIAATGDFSQPLIDQTDLRRSELRVSTPLPPGAYHWRVGAIDARGKAGPFGDAIAFEVHDAAQPPAVETDTPDGVLQVRWQAGEADTRYRFQLSRSTGFERLVVDRTIDDTVIALPEARSGTWYMRVQSIHSDGHVEDFGQVQTLQLGCPTCRYWLGGAALLLLAL